MPIEDLIARRITGIQPFNELGIDADIWKEAHGHHQQHRSLHAVALHRPGIVHGLEVVVKPGKTPTVKVAPGVGIDPVGRTIVLAQAVEFTLTQSGDTYITLGYEDNYDRNSARNVGGTEKYFRLVEGRSVVATQELPKEPYLELARIHRSKADSEIKAPKNPFDPNSDELNLLFRVLAFPHCYADGSVGELSFLPTDDPSNWKPNRAGLLNMIRYANGNGFHVSYSGVYNLRNPSGTPPLMLYAAAGGDFRALADEQVKGLGSYLEGGGVLYAEAAGGNEAFIEGAKSLVEKLGAKLKPIENSSIMSAHHLFAAAPFGAAEGPILADENLGVIVSGADLGGAWQGAMGKKAGPESRERIRAALEFATNVLVTGSRRQRQRAIERM